MKKILHHYKDFDMEPLFGLDLKMLPVILAWLESVCVDDDDEVNVGGIRARMLSESCR